MLGLISHRALIVALGIAAAAGPAQAFGEKVSADLKDKSGAVVGSTEMVAGSGGVLVKLRLKGLAPGGHALRVLEAGKCEGDFSSAGDIYNPLGAKFGLLNEEGPMAGEMPNVFVSSTGDAEVELLNHFITLAQDAEVTLIDNDGASIVVFDKPSDHVSEPEGNAGGRIACGVLAPAK